jgi:hypothetical protein
LNSAKNNERQLRILRCFQVDRVSINGMIATVLVAENEMTGNRLSAIRAKFKTDSRYYL